MADLSQVMIAPVEVNSPAAHHLITLLDEELSRQYPAEAIHGFRPTDIVDPDLLFLVASIHHQPVGCGALRPLAAGEAEVKRMFVVFEYRRRGLARQLLLQLEAHARERGYSVLKLETGVRQPESISLYKSASFVEIPPFGEYVSNPFSVCFEKHLAPPA